MQALVIGGVIGGMGGVIDAIKTSGADPNGFRPQVTFFTYTALLLGGAATYLGPVLGAILFWFLREWIESFLRQLAAEAWLPNAVADFIEGSEGVISVAMVGLALILLMLLRPQGNHRQSHRNAVGCPMTRPQCPDRPRPVTGIEPILTVPPVPGAAKPNPILVVDNLSRSFGGLRAVDVDHLEVERGVVTSLIGPNGGGQDHPVQPADRFRPGRHRALVVRRADGHVAVARSAGPTRHHPHFPAHQVAGQADGSRECAAGRPRPGGRAIVGRPVPVAVAGSGAGQHRAGRGAAGPVQPGPHARRAGRPRCREASANCWRWPGR